MRKDAGKGWNAKKKQDRDEYNNLYKIRTSVAIW